MAKLRQQREAAAHGAPVQGWLADWWKRLLIDQRRLLLAVAGLDDSELIARRPWEQMTISQRDALIAECKKVARLVKPVEWA